MTRNGTRNSAEPFIWLSKVVRTPNARLVSTKTAKNTCITKLPMDSAIPDQQERTRCAH